MRVTIIASHAKNRVIGANNALPWRLKTDMRIFVIRTLFRPVVMGRKTHESIGKTLAQRANIVMTKNHLYQAIEGAIVVHTVDEAIAQAKQNINRLANPAGEVVIIGGEEIYRLFLPIASEAYITEINADIEGDAHFPELGSNWEELSRSSYPAQLGDDYDFDIVHYINKGPIK